VDPPDATAANSAATAFAADPEAGEPAADGGRARDAIPVAGGTQQPKQLRGRVRQRERAGQHARPRAARARHAEAGRRARSHVHRAVLVREESWLASETAARAPRSV